MKNSKSDFRQEVTDEVIKLIEAGTAPWIMPWQTGEIAAAFNPTTNMPYRGGNIISLMYASLRKGYTDPRWMTYRQAAEKGWQVRKGEKASRIEFFKEDKKENETTGGANQRLIVRHYPVFNAQQIECMYDRNSEDYAREELVAELASLFVSAETGLPFDPSQHAAYIKSWLRALKRDKNEIFRAASSASKATDDLLQKKAAKAKTAHHWTERKQWSAA